MTATSPYADAQLPVADTAAIVAGLRAFLAADSRSFAATLIMNCLAAASALVPPWLLGTLVNVVSGSRDLAMINVLGASILMAALVQTLLTRYAQLGSFRFGERVIARLREEYVTRVLALPAAAVERTSIGDLTVRSTGDIDTISATVRYAAPQILLSALWALFIVVATAVLNPVFGACALLGIPLIAGVTRWYLRRARVAYLAEGTANSALAETFVEAVDGAGTIAAFGLGRQRMTISDQRIDAARSTRLRTLSLRTVLFPAVDLAHVIPLVAVLIAGALLRQRGLVSLGACVSAGAYMWGLARPLDAILGWVETLQSSSASLARVLGLPEVPPARAPDGQVPRNGDVVLSGVSFSYDERRPRALHDLSLTIPAGVRLAVVGPSGAGKSTLARLLAGVDEPQAGSITIGGVRPVLLADADRQRQVVLVTQEPHVFIGSLRDNLSIAHPDATDAQMRAALIDVGGRWVAELPEGLGTRLGPGGLRLDPARTQQVALARIALANPRIIILDEATALLPPAAAQSAEHAISRSFSGQTVVAIAHRLHTARDGDLILVLENGRMRELGSHAELLANGRTYAHLWQAWQNGESNSCEGGTRPEMEPG